MASGGWEEVRYRSRFQGGAKTGPVNNDPNEISDLGLVGHLSDLVDCRSKKRPRVETCGVNTIPNNFLDLSSMTPDLNLPPPGKNLKPRRRRLGSNNNHEQRCVTGAQTSQDGVFFFGSSSEPGQSNQVGYGDNSNSESQLLVEAEETITVGKLVGLDVDDFRDQIVEFLGGRYL
ncbi:hypothetical protein R6Q59_012038 [Mikania micrantha]